MSTSNNLARNSDDGLLPYCKTGAKLEVPLLDFVTQCVMRMSSSCNSQSLSNTKKDFLRGSYKTRSTHIVDIMEQLTDVQYNVGQATAYLASPVPNAEIRVQSHVTSSEIHRG
jgi:hypothetical protein